MNTRPGICNNKFTYQKTFPSSGKNGHSSPPQTETELIPFNERPLPPILSDENIGSPIIALFRRAGFDVLTVSESRLNGSRDRVIIKYAAALGRILITHDKKLAKRKFFVTPSGISVILLPTQEEKKERWINSLYEQIIHHFLNALLIKQIPLKNSSIQYRKNGHGSIYSPDPKRPGECVETRRFSFLRNNTNSTQVSAIQLDCE